MPQDCWCHLVAWLAMVALCLVERLFSLVWGLPPFLRHATATYHDPHCRCLQMADRVWTSWPACWVDWSRSSATACHAVASTSSAPIWEYSQIAKKKNNNIFYIVENPQCALKRIILTNTIVYFKTNYKLNTMSCTKCFKIHYTN